MASTGKTCALADGSYNVAPRFFVWRKSENEGIDAPPNWSPVMGHDQVMFHMA
jgi:hypothetical protein